MFRSAGWTGSRVWPIKQAAAANHPQLGHQPNHPHIQLTTPTKTYTSIN